MSYPTHLTALLALEDGRVFSGASFGAMGTYTGEICFNTSMSGYQEVLTDPSYRGQIVAMTTPHLGNYGTNNDDCEGDHPHVRGFVMEEMSDVASSWRSQWRLQEYLQKHAIVAISEVDTRALTQHLRVSGVMRACITSEQISHKEAIALAKNSPFLEEIDLVSEVSTKEAYEWDPEGSEGTPWGVIARLASKQHRQPLLVAYDFGIKKNILRLLRAHGLRVMVMPAATSAEKVLSLNPDGIFFSNGPGDPAQLSSLHQRARFLSDHKPVFGICLGHQILGHAFGASTFKLKFGHRGANHPVQDLRNQRVIITAQNHGYAIDEETLPAELEITHRHLNDQTIAGFRHRTKPLFAVQFHPEASPGPHDSIDLFREFAEMLGVSFVK
ncbi:MAG: glutamine-hydrolyzing carbamoyl-phosphate synthase small subunit [Chthoniobacterales bacterium]